MLQNALDILRKEGKEILVCLSGSDEAQKAWLSAGGEAGYALSPSGGKLAYDRRRYIAQGNRFFWYAGGICFPLS